MFRHDCGNSIFNLDAETKTETNKYEQNQINLLSHSQNENPYQEGNNTLSSAINFGA